MNAQQQQKIVYGRAAYEGFAKAIASTMGLKASIIDGQSACIDAGGTIRMPGMNKFQTSTEFAVTCGVIVHEMAHQFYGSHGHIDPKRSRLEHDCLNAVLDVADETWVSEWFNRRNNARPGELLDIANVDAAYRNASRGGPFGDWGNLDTHAWKVLCVGILLARRVRKMGRWGNYTARMAARFSVDAKACFRLLRSARRGKKQDPAPTAKRFRKLITLAKRLADLLAPFAPPPGAPVVSIIMPLDAALDQGTDRQPANTQVAGEADGANGASGQGASNSAGAASGDGDGSSNGNFDQSSYDMLAPAVQKVAQRIATDGDGMQYVDGLTSGCRLGQAYRLITDGQCLARWDETDNAEGVSVSVLLDCSSSMSSRLAECAGVARAFAVNMREAGPVQTLVFGGRVAKSDDFANVRPMGSTNTHLALEKANKWLASRPGRRWIVLITDGQPSDHAACDRLCNEAAAHGIRILAVGLDCSIVMPHTTSVVASDATHLAIELGAAAQQIEGA